jgi:hypothetical protein
MGDMDSECDVCLRWTKYGEWHCWDCDPEVEDTEFCYEHYVEHMLSKHHKRVR